MMEGGKEGWKELKWVADRVPRESKMILVQGEQMMRG